MNCSASRSTCLSLILLAILAWLAVGCAAAPEATSTPASTALPATQTPQTAVSATPAPTQAESGALHLILWIPPQFDPYTQGRAGALLSARLEEFEAQNPGVTIEVRLKAPSGSGGLLDALSSTLAAAPMVAPSVVALSRSDMESAALKGLISPLDDLQTLIEDTDWYPFAREMARVDGVVFGLPFSGDVLLLVYRPAQVGDLFKNAAMDGGVSWQALTGQSYPLIFPAASTQALVTISLYRSLDGAVLDGNGRPMLDAAVLEQVYQTYADGVRNGAFPPLVTTLENDAQAWQTFSEGRGNVLITWSSIYLQNLPADTTAALFTGMQSSAYTLADGWVWVVSDPSPERQELSQKLAVFLSESDFVSSWSEAIGSLPARPSALAAWQNQSLAASLHQMAVSAHLRPDGVVVSSLGPALHDTLLDVIKQKSVPQDAAERAAQSLIFPNE